MRYTDDHGKPKVESEQMKLPPDLANGMTLTLLKNLRAECRAADDVDGRDDAEAAAGEAGAVRSRRGSAVHRRPSARKATHYVVKIEIGGLAGLVAPLVGKQPPDTHVWILGGEAPAFVKSEGAMFLGGPIWRIELVSPVWPGETRSSGSSRR